MRNVVLSSPSTGSCAQAADPMWTEHNTSSVLATALLGPTTHLWAKRAQKRYFEHSFSGTFTPSFWVNLQGSLVSYTHYPQDL